MVIERMPDKQHVYLGVEAIVASHTMCELMELVERAARTSATVLITGETGSGKEIVARAIHHYSLRASRPWVDFNCAALPEHLVESELFGHEKGAFSGADSAKPGLFDLANTGTLFLDEIGELELRVQVKLLRVLDGVPYYRVGGQKKIPVDARVVAATNQNLEAAVQARRFRADLFHRLNQCQIRVPSLRERRDDIVPIAEYFLRQHAEHARFSAEASRALESHSWPGNVRELRNAVIQAVVTARTYEIGIADLPQLQAAAPPRPIARGHLELDLVEKDAIFAALQQTGGHQQKAATLLGVSRRTLSRKLKLYYAETEKDFIHA